MSTFPFTDLRPPLPPGTFEAHVTVAAPDDAALHRFAASCAALGVKQIHIELSRGEARFQPMTSSHHRGTLADVRRDVEAIAAALSSAGLEVTRVKIEALGDNPVIPRSDAEAAARGSAYFEFHAEVTLPEARTPEVRALCERLGAHLSRNARRADGEGTPARFVTLRVPGEGREAAEGKLAGLLAGLAETGLPVFHLLREYTVYDSNVDLDRGWLAP
jgi:hypothetical protein